MQEIVLHLKQHFLESKIYIFKTAYASRIKNITLVAHKF